MQILMEMDEERVFNFTIHLKLYQCSNMFLRSFEPWLWIEYDLINLIVSLKINDH